MASGAADETAAIPRNPIFVQDDVVMATNDDATSSKRYATSLGYWKDAYIQLFCKQVVKKAPEINRGYFARVYAVRTLLQQYIKLHNRSCQIVNLGAGYDTTFWHLAENQSHPLHYVEVDFPGVTRQKTRVIHAKKEILWSKLGQDAELMEGHLGILSDWYSLIPIDLKNTSDLLQMLDRCKIDPAKPTLILVECVFMYMKPEDVDNLLTVLARTYSDAVIINYDTINMTDRFAEVMLENLQIRQCKLHTKDCIDKNSQRERFRRCGWQNTEVHNMTDVYKNIPAAERLRIERLEFLDEVHLFLELMNHYCICLAQTSNKLRFNLQALDFTL